MANVGLFLGLLSVSWTYISTKEELKQFGQSGGEFAEHFLETLADGDVYSAAELQQPLNGRQLAGIDLKAYYESYKGKSDVPLTEAGAPDPKMLAKSVASDLKKHAVTKYVAQYPNAKWPFSHLHHVAYNPGNTQMVQVVVFNSEDRSQRLLVALQRIVSDEAGAKKAGWCVRDMKLL
jgi:hypothetical protein